MNGGLMKAAGHSAVAALTGLLLSTGSAFAADLGGNCCADLEERVAELEATTARKGNRRVSLVISGQVNTAVMAWDNSASSFGPILTPAGATTSPSSVTGKHSSDVYVVDNGVSRSGFNFDGNARINPNLTAGFTVVVGVSTGARSHQTSESQSDGSTGDDGIGGAFASIAAASAIETFMVIELANWYLDHKQFGRLTVGRINGASAGTTIVDLSGAGVIANANIGLWQRGFTMVNSNGTYVNAPTQGNVGGTVSTWSAFMGGGAVNVSSLNRSNAVSYTTPTWHGFSAQAAWGEDDMADAAIRYAGEWHGFRVAAAVAWARNVSGVNDTVDLNPNGLPGGNLALGSDTNRWQGSASILHVATGLFLSGAYVQETYNGNADFERRCISVLANGLCEEFGENRSDVTMWYLIGGIAKNWTGLGNTVFFGEYANVDDGAAGFVVNGEILRSSSAQMWGVGVVQNVDAAAMELYLAYRQYSADARELDTGFGQSYEDFNVVMGGARIRF